MSLQMVYSLQEKINLKLYKFIALCRPNSMSPQLVYSLQEKIILKSTNLLLYVDPTLCHPNSMSAQHNWFTRFTINIFIITLHMYAYMYLKAYILL